MQTTITMTPDQLAQVLAGVFEANGYENVQGVAITLAGQVVGYDAVTVYCAMPEGIEVFPRPQTNKDLLKMFKSAQQLNMVGGE